MKLFLLFLFINVCLSSNAFADCLELDKWAMKHHGKRFCYQGFSVDFGRTGKLAEQVRYFVHSDSTIVPVFDRSHSFDEGSVERQREVKAHNNGYDFAHLVPEALSHLSFYEANDSALKRPMRRSLNRVLMPKLEAFEVATSALKGQLLVTNGVIGDENVQALYKIIHHQKSNAAIAFLIPNRDDLSTDIADYITSIKCIEKSKGSKVIRNPTNYSDWKVGQAYSLDIWFQGGAREMAKCQH
jgi:hypothetical protein